MSYPPCHAFYLSLIALFFPASLCLPYLRQYLCSLSRLTPLPLPLSTFFTQMISNLFVFFLSVFFSFFFFFTLSDYCLLMNDCSFCGGNCAFHTLVFKRGAYLTSCVECCCHSAPPASCKVILRRGVADRVQDDMWTSSTEHTATYCARKDHA